MTEEQFYEHYKPQINHIERALQPDSVKDEDICSFAGCLYETYGEDYQYISELFLSGENKRIWTILEVDESFYISAGIHHVNRYGYIVTEKEWQSDSQEIKID